MKILVVVPAFNEAQNLPKVIQQLSCLSYVDIIVINDGSEDKTSQVLQEYPHIVTLHLPYNAGIGVAMQTGYRYAWENGYDIAIQFDGDGQHNASSISAMVETLSTSKADMVIGSRFLESRGFKSTFFRRIGIFYFSALISLILKKKLRILPQVFELSIVL